MTFREQAEQTYREAIETIEVAEKLSFVYHVIPGAIWSYNIAYSELPSLLTELKTLGKYKLWAYYMTGDTLALRYTVQNYDISFTFYITDYENALEQISKGKCKIEEITETSKEVVCTL